MSKATLNYIIDNKELMICKDSLSGIDKYTCNYKNADDLKQSPSLKDKIKEFSRVNNKDKGSFQITYIDGYRKKDLKPLFNDKTPIVLTDDLMNGRISEFEKSRKLLFNSKKQLFCRGLYKNENINDSLEMDIKISDEEKNILLYSGIKVISDNYNNFVSLKDLVRYRITHSKLGIVRPIYEDALEVWKKELEYLRSDDLYFYSREFRILYNDYVESMKDLTVSRLKVSSNIAKIRKGYSIYYSPYKRCEKLKTYKKSIESNF